MSENNWSTILKNEFSQPYFQQLAAFLKREYETKTIYPPRESVFSCFGYTDYTDLKVVLIGQDPYKPMDAASRYDRVSHFPPACKTSIRNC
jgi:uracil-DNA glycosylase